jgi:hypothetical protein
MRAAPPPFAQIPHPRPAHVHGVTPMTSRSTSPTYTAIATAALAAMLLIVPIGDAEAGKKGSRAARDHSVGKLQCQGHCPDRHVRDQVVPRGKNKAEPNPVVRDHRGPNGVQAGDVKVTSQPRPPKGDLCAGWGC